MYPMVDRDNLCKELQNKIGEILIEKEESLRLRDICGILDMTKHFFLMKVWKKVKW